MWDLNLICWRDWKKYSWSEWEEPWAGRGTAALGSTLLNACSQVMILLPGLFGLNVWNQSMYVMLARILVWIWSPRSDFAMCHSVGFQRFFLEVWIYWSLSVQTASSLVGRFAGKAIPANCLWWWLVEVADEVKQLRIDSFSSSTYKSMPAFCEDLTQFQFMSSHDIYHRAFHCVTNTYHRKNNSPLNQPSFHRNPEPVYSRLWIYFIFCFQNCREYWKTCRRQYSCGGADIYSQRSCPQIVLSNWQK